MLSPNEVSCLAQRPIASREVSVVAAVDGHAARNAQIEARAYTAGLARRLGDVHTGLIPFERNVGQAVSCLVGVAEVAAQQECLTDGVEVDDSNVLERELLRGVGVNLKNVAGGRREDRNVVVHLEIAPAQVMLADVVVSLGHVL